MNTEEQILNDYKYTTTPLELLAEQLPTSRVVTIVAPYSKLDVLEWDGEWLKVKYHEYEGYVRQELVSVTKETIASVRLKSQPKVKSLFMGTIPKYSRVEVVDHQGEWSRIFDGHRLGYILTTQIGDCQLSSHEEGDKPVHHHKSLPHINLFK